MPEKKQRACALNACSHKLHSDMAILVLASKHQIVFVWAFSQTPLNKLFCARWRSFKGRENKTEKEKQEIQISRDAPYY